MMNDKKSYKISILGEPYLLVSDETEDHIRGAAQLVNRYMQDIEHIFLKNNQPPLQKGVMLAVMRMASDLQKTNDAYHRLSAMEKHLVLLIDKVSSLLSS